MASTIKLKAHPPPLTISYTCLLHTDFCETVVRIFKVGSYIASIHFIVTSNSHDAIDALQNLSIL